MFNPHFLRNAKRVNLCAKIDSLYPIFTLERDILDATKSKYIHQNKKYNLV